MMLELTGEGLTIEDVVLVAREGRKVADLSESVKECMQVSREWVKEAIYQKGEVIYGVNTGFGPLATKHIEPKQARILSRNVILSCLAGVGSPLAMDVVRAMMLIRANTLAKGHSGVRPVLAQTIIDMLNAGVTPFVPCKGSLGASGDLAPLAHIAVVLTKDVEQERGDYSGQAWLNGELMSGAEAMERVGIERIVPEAKDGLALTNGTNFMAAVGALVLVDAENLLANAEIAAALSMEALKGLSSAFHPALHEVNNQPGQMKTASNLRRLLAGSRLIDTAQDRVQDAYSLRCTPQVLGPIHDILDFLRERISGAINAVSDNPLIFVDLPDDQPQRAISGGNFHGEGLAMWLDFLGIALSVMGNNSERRTFRLLTPELSDGLPSMLVPKPGLDSGLMIPQYTAAALVSENKTLAHPDCVDSIPSSANQEDFVSMGANAARHTLEISRNVSHILAIEFLTAAQGVDLRSKGPERLSPATTAAYKEIRRIIEPLDHDRQLTPGIEALSEKVRSGDILKAVRSALGDGFD
jgi:histidine ammonia-lyase